MKICVIDDEPIICRGTEEIIRDVTADAEVMGFTDAQKAWEHLREHPADAVFLDIEMPGIDGVELAGRIRAIHPMCNIIFVTAFSRYQNDAWRMHASGYVMKPLTRERVREELEVLRFDVSKGREEEFFIRAFGNFEVLYQGRPMKFAYSKTKELIAFLVDRCGAMVSVQECIETLWGEDEIRTSYFKRLRQDLLSVFDEVGLTDLILRQRGYLGIDRGRVSCDYFSWLDGEPAGINAWNGEYMTQYAWAEGTRGKIIESGAVKAGEAEAAIMADPAGADGGRRTETGNGRETL